MDTSVALQKNSNTYRHRLFPSINGFQLIPIIILNNRYEGHYLDLVDLLRRIQGYLLGEKKLSLSSWCLFNDNLITNMNGLLQNIISTCFVIISANLTWDDFSLRSCRLFSISSMKKETLGCVFICKEHPFLIFVGKISLEMVLWAWYCRNF